jgi:hypothetical protein
MNTNNSISNTLTRLLEINTNALRTFERINEAVTTNEKNIPLEILTEEGGTKTVTVPSFGYMHSELERLSNNLKALSGLGQGSTKIKLPDGTFQKVITSSLKTPADDITNVVRPTSFGTKSNYFFEDFLNPLLTTSINVGGQIPNETERVLVKRIIFNSTNEPTVEYFNNNFKNKESVNYFQALRDIVNNNLTYIIDEEVRDMPYRSQQFVGKFDVLKISTAKRDVLKEGVTVKRSIKRFALDKLTYSDSKKELNDTELLKIGDELTINGGSKNTRYKIVKLDGSTNEVELELVEGYESIKIGVNQLSVYKPNAKNLNIDINVGFNERILVFFKAIDPDSKILAENWSPGFGLYTNELTLLQEDGASIRLDDYYKEEVADFGQFIQALKEDSIPPATVGVTPDAPTLDTSNFKVVQINRHVSANNVKDKITKLSSDKTAVDENIKKLDETISKKRSEISTKKYESNVQRDKDKNELASLIEERTNETNLYNSVVNQVQSLSASTDASKVKPKYRVRGFWTVPTPKKVADTADQKIVKFKIQYRYLSTSGEAADAVQLPFTEGTREKTAVFSNWNEKTTKVRDRKRNSITGKFEWKDSKVEDGQEVNFNQLDIAIREGELVEIRVKSISEAGYPSNAIESDWSEPITIDFPEAEIDTTDLENLVQQNTAELAKVKIAEELASKGVYSHINDSFSANEKYWAHSATGIASGFLSPEQKPISVYDKIAQLEAQIAELKGTVEVEVGELIVKLQDEDGTVTVIKKDTTNQIFAGYYVNEVAELSIKKGHIVTKTYKLILENTKATKLELISRLTGDRTSPAHRSSASGDTVSTNFFGIQKNDQGVGNTDNKISSDSYYTSEGRYDVAPVQYQSLSGNQISSLDNLDEAPYQSAQRRGQFVYSRYMDVANRYPLYCTEPLIGNDNLNLESYEFNLDYAKFNEDNFESGIDGSSNLLQVDGNATSTNFIWAGTFGRNAAGGSGNANLSATELEPALIDVCSISRIGAIKYNNGIFLHKDHPDLANLYNDVQENASNPSAVTEAEQKTNLQETVNNAIYTMPISATYATGTSFWFTGTSLYTNPLFNPIGSSFFTTATTSIQAKKQLGYRVLDHDEIQNGEVERSFKMSFDVNDQFLLGGKSVGAFLYLSPINLNTLSVDGDTKQSRKQIKGRVASQDTSNGLSVDIVFQYRMTDYYGNNATQDRGRIGGQAKLTFPNLTYTKKIGLDIFDKYDEQFSFDLEVFAKYRSKGKSLNSIRAARLIRR